MIFDTVLTTAVTHELTGLAVGARVDKVSQHAPDDVILTLFRTGQRRSLLISTNPSAARIHLTEHRHRKNPTEALSFCMLLRKYIEGAAVESVTQPLGFTERVIKITFSGNQGVRTHLWAELMGRQSNLILTDDSLLILGSIKRVTPQMSRLREIRTGIIYTNPPQQSEIKHDPTLPFYPSELPNILFSDDKEAAQWVMNTFRGVGSLLAMEAVRRDINRPLDTMTVWSGLHDLLTGLLTGETSPVIYRDNSGQIKGAYPIPLLSVASSLQSPITTISEAIEMAFDSGLSENVLESERGALLSALRKSAKSNERLLTDVREGILNSQLSQSHRENGELLLANTGHGTDTADVLIVDDYFADNHGAKRSIKIDPALSIRENAERYFRRFQKARDSRKILERREVELAAQTIEIADGIASAERATDVAQLKAIVEALPGLIRGAQSSSTHTGQTKPQFDGHKIRSLRTSDGWEILVGENSTSNDYITTKLASPSDIWLHARAVHSAHAIIRSQNRPQSVSAIAIRMAAEEVAKRSKAKHAGVVSIDYTLKKYVRKPRGSAPGQVSYSNEKTIDVSPVC
jgi:predicted ribosome quality control (RQC) complex YloA/Tae2 family protein